MTQRQPEVTYEFIDQDEIERRIRRACEILINSDVECVARRVVVPSDEIGDSDLPHNTHINRTLGNQPSILHAT